MGEGGADGKDREPLQRSKVQMENEVSPNLWIKKDNFIRRAGYQQFYHNFDDPYWSLNHRWSWDNDIFNYVCVWFRIVGSSNVGWQN